MGSVIPDTQIYSKDERIYHNTNAAYALPNDNPEHARLEAQAKLLRELMNNQIIHAPLAPSVQKCLDIGCGTGIVTQDIASDFPKAQVYGIDLSPVPDIREKLPNIEYIQGDLTELSDPKNLRDPRFEGGSFDLIFSRLLIAGVTNWKGYIERCVALTKPGGWIEMHEMDFFFNRIPSDATPSQRESLHPHNLSLPSLAHPLDSWAEPTPWVDTLHNLCAAKDMNGRCGRQLPQLFAEAGLQDVQVKRYMYPHTNWEGYTPLEKRFALHHREAIGAHMPCMLRRIATGQNVVSKEEVEAAAEGARKHNEAWDVGREFCWFYVVSGRKRVE